MQFHLLTDGKQEWRWRLYTDNDVMFANSGDGYRNRQECLDAVNALKRDVATARVFDITPRVAEEIVP
jgi:uncharacterized protein